MSPYELDESVFPGFEVERDDGRQASLVESAEALLEQVRFYRSGASRPAEFNGYATNDVPVGVVIGELSAPMLARLREYVDQGGLVFVDSGVYSSGPAREVNFHRVMEQYVELAATVSDPEGLLMVMPDRMGDFAGTLELLRSFRGCIAALRQAGVEVLVPLQLGAVDAVAGYDALVDALGFEDFCLGLPCKANMHPIEEIARLMAVRVPRRVHLLGVGANLHKLFRLTYAIGSASPSTRLSADSCRIRALVGQGAPVTVGTRIIALRAEGGLRDIAPLRARLWPDPTVLYGVVREFGRAFGYGDDETELMADLCSPESFPVSELVWLAEYLTVGATSEEAQAIAEYWFDHGLVFDDLHEVIDELARQHQRPRQCAVEAATAIEESGGRLRRSRTQGLPLAA